MIQNNISLKTSSLTMRTRYFTLCKCSHSRPSGRGISYSTITTALTDKLNLVTKQFDNVLGISEVRSAQSLVQAAEDGFMKSRRLVQDTRTELVRLQNQLRDLRSKLDRIPREDERYLQLATEEHKVLIAERGAKTRLETLETLERDQFAALSGAVRGAHEKERSRAERTKYWSIIGSACGAVLGILGSTIINMRRMKQIRLTVKENNEAFIAKTMDELSTLLKPEQQEQTANAEVAQTQNQTLNNFLGLALLSENKNMLNAIHAKLETFSNEETLASKEQGTALEGGQLLNLENSSSFVELHRRIEDLAWWSKASLIASVTASACLMFYIVSK